MLLLLNVIPKWECNGCLTNVVKNEKKKAIPMLYKLIPLLKSGFLVIQIVKVDFIDDILSCVQRASNVNG